jgi:hexosaminidase
LHHHQGWEDAFSMPRGGHLPVAKLALPDLVTNAWYHIWGGGIEGNMHAMANAGYHVVLSSTSHLYFDNPQEPDPEDWGLHWATRYVDTKRTFSYRPDSFYDNIDFGYWGERLSKEQVCQSQHLCPPLRQPSNVIGMSSAYSIEP